MDELLQLDVSEHLRLLITGALPKIGVGLLVMLAFFVAATVARLVLWRLGRLLEPHRRAAARLGGVAAYWGINAFGLVTGFGTMGVDVAAMVAGLGLTGFALGFALRDAVSNLLAGVLVMTYQPFRPGDRIAVAGFDGLVLDTDLRYTTVQGDGRRYLIPNQTLFSSPLTVIETKPATTGGG